MLTARLCQSAQAQISQQLFDTMALTFGLQFRPHDSGDPRTFHVAPPTHFDLLQ